MKGIRARVVNGRFVVDTPAPFPDGTELDFQIADDGDEMDEAEQAALDAALSKAWEEAKAGKAHPLDEVLKRLGKPK